MQRRAFLAALAAAASVAAARPFGTRRPAAVDALPSTAPDGTPLPVPWRDIREPVHRDYIPAITDPAFGPDWEGVRVGARDGTARADGLDPRSAVVGVEREGRARAYPLRVLDWHEVVNDDFGGPLLVTYCPLCGSAVVAERRVAGRETTFGVSGKLYRNALVLYDAATESLWSQLLATAIRGPRTGAQLSLLPASLSTWGAWRDRHPDGEVLLPPPQSGTVTGGGAVADYRESKYGYEDEAGVVGWQDGTDEGPGRRTLVLGVVVDGTARAYPYRTVAAAGAVQDDLGDVPLVVVATPGGSLAAYDRRVDGRVLDLEGGPGGLQAGGSTWDPTTGHALDGPHAGRRLRDRAAGPPLFWAGWRALHPETTVFRV